MWVLWGLGLGVRNLEFASAWHLNAFWLNISSFRVVGSYEMSAFWRQALERFRIASEASFRLLVSRPGV